MNELITGMVVSALWNALAHWLPWEQVMGRHVNAHKLTSYVIGGMGVVAGCAATRKAVEWWEVLAVFAASGAATGACYVLRWGVGVLNELRVLRMVKEKATQ